MGWGRMTMTSRLGRPAFLLGAAAAVLLVATPVAAQDSDETDNDDRGYTVTLGAGAQFSPEFPGADSLRFYPVPSIGVRRQGDPLTFEAPDEGWGFGILGEDDVFDFGPAVQFEAKRREEDVGAAVGIVTGLTYKLDRHWGLYGWAGYDRLIDDAADSPIVRAFGSRDQFSAGFAVIYEFDIADPF